MHRLDNSASFGDEEHLGHSIRPPKNQSVPHRCFGLAQHEKCTHNLHGVTPHTCKWVHSIVANVKDTTITSQNVEDGNFFFVDYDETRDTSKTERKNAYEKYVWRLHKSEPMNMNETISHLPNETIIARVSVRAMKELAIFHWQSILSVHLNLNSQRDRTLCECVWTCRSRKVFPLENQKRCCLSIRFEIEKN